MDAGTKEAMIGYIADVHAALHLLAVEVLRDAEPDAIFHAVELVEDEVRYLSQ